MLGEPCCMQAKAAPDIQDRVAEIPRSFLDGNPRGNSCGFPRDAVARDQTIKPLPFLGARLTGEEPVELSPIGDHVRERTIELWTSLCMGLGKIWEKLGFLSPCRWRQLGVICFLRQRRAQALNVTAHHSMVGGKSFRRLDNRPVREHSPIRNSPSPRARSG